VAAVFAVANKLKDAGGRLRLFRPILDIASRRLRRYRCPFVRPTIHSFEFRSSKVVM
jgi:hypothetical protein